MSLEKFKLSSLTWDSDADAHGFYLWVENTGSLVRGLLLDTYLALGIYAGRVKTLDAGRP